MSEYYIKINEKVAEVFVEDNFCAGANFETPLFQGGESCIHPEKGCDWMCILGVEKDLDGDEHDFPIYAETVDFEEIGAAHHECGYHQKCDKDGNLLDENGDIIEEEEDEDESDCDRCMRLDERKRDIEWVWDDDAASYPYLVEAIKRHAKENNIDISRAKF